MTFFDIAKLIESLADVVRAILWPSAIVISCKALGAAWCGRKGGRDA